MVQASRQRILCALVYGKQFPVNSGNQLFSIELKRCSQCAEKSPPASERGHSVPSMTFPIMPPQLLPFRRCCTPCMPWLEPRKQSDAQVPANSGDSGRWLCTPVSHRRSRLLNGFNIPNTMQSTTESAAVQTSIHVHPKRLTVYINVASRVLQPQDSPTEHLSRPSTDFFRLLFQP